MKTRPLQIGILIMGVIAAGFIVYRLAVGTEAVHLEHRLLLVDVQNGQIYEVSTAKRAIMEPAAAPGTTELRLVRVGKEDDGKWYVGKRAMSILKDINVNPSVVDEESGEVLTPSADIRHYENK